MSEPTVQPIAPGPPAPPATPPTPVRPPDPQRALQAIAWIAGTFSAIVVVTMLYFHFTAAANDPWKSPQLLALRARLAVEPKNEAVKEQIRQLDFQFRHQFRQRLARDRFGAWLLAGGAEPSRVQCEAILQAAIAACERYYQAFQFVIWAGRTAREALDAALFETAGEA